MLKSVLRINFIDSIKFVMNYKQIDWFVIRVVLSSNFHLSFFFIVQ